MERKNHLLFEKSLQSFIDCDKNSKIELSSEHVKYLETSLKWTIGQEGKLYFNTKIPYKPFSGSLTDQKRDSFVVWLYNEIPTKGKLVFEFEKEGIMQCEFDFFLEFEGWRCAWVDFERDMKGKPVSGMDKLTIKATEDRVGKNLYFSQMILATPLDTRHHTRTEQTPFVNLEADEKGNSHWMSLYTFNEAKRAFKPLKNVSQEQKEQVDLIEQRFWDYLYSKKEPLAFMPLESSYKRYEMSVQADGTIKGRSVDYKNALAVLEAFGKAEYEAKFKTIDAVEYMTTLYEIALFYNKTHDQAQKMDAKKMYMNMFVHLYNQGFASGSSAGTLHHLGYDMKPYPQAVYLMKDVLKEEGWGEKAEQVIGWFSGVGRIFYENLKADGVNMDVLNTMTEGMLASILIIENKSLKAELLEYYTKWLAFSCSPKSGLAGPFKYDGLGYHHGNFYPAYTRDGLEGLIPIIYLLRGTKFRLPEKQHALIKKAVMNFRLFSNREHFLMSVSGRHPKGTEKFSSLAFKQMALSGTPDGKKEIDEALAAAYMRLTDNKEDQTIKAFMTKGIEEEKAPVGNWALNYAALSLHRRADWLVGVRGHSRYLWGNETYEANNLYGRYITYGQIEIINKPVKEIKKENKVVDVDRSFHQEGWDWNCFPGTTTIHLPIDDLKSDVRNVDTFSGFEEMLISDETYVGALDLEGQNGMFAMKLHEHPKYNGSHHARKSVFMFEDRIVCLGSNIENNDAIHQTQTTLFQNYLLDTQEPIYINSSEQITGLSYSQTLQGKESKYLLDNENNGYLLPKGQKITITRLNQVSKDQNKGIPTSGNFTKAVIEHGNAPKNEAYEYMIAVNTTLEALQKLHCRQQSSKSIYTVLQKDRLAHIVKDHRTNSIGYALFEPNQALLKGDLISIDTPAMVMTKEKEGQLILSIVDPDLRLYEGIDKTQYDQEGVQKEVSIYSRPWMNNPSKEHTLKVEVVGTWKLSKERVGCRVLSYNNRSTLLVFDMKEGCKIEVILEKLIFS